MSALWTPAGAAGTAPAPSFNEVMGFSGAPELINGRLAMIAFTSAVAAELSSGAARGIPILNWVSVT